MNTQNAWGEEPFTMAEDNGQPAIMEMLRREGVDKDKHPYYKEKWG